MITSRQTLQRRRCFYSGNASTSNRIQLGLEWAISIPRRVSAETALQVDMAHSALTECA